MGDQQPPSGEAGSGDGAGGGFISAQVEEIITAAVTSAMAKQQLGCWRGSYAWNAGSVCGLQMIRISGVVLNSAPGTD